MSKPYDFARIYYWDVELIEPDDPDDDRYILLHGEEGEVVGPMSVESAQAWIDRSRCRPNSSRLSSGAVEPTAPNTAAEPAPIVGG